MHAEREHKKKNKGKKMLGPITPENPAPLYEQIEEDIKRKIASQELKVRDRIGTQEELAIAYNVSMITVKRAIANLIKEGVLYSRVGLGTFVAEQRKRKLSSSRHRIIGLVLRDLKHPYFSMIVHSVEERASQLGFTILLSSSSGDLEREEFQINHFRELGAEGLIIASLSLEYKASAPIQKIHEENFPYVMVSYIHDPEYWYVGSDHEFGGFIATDHLIKTGYRSIGYVHVSPGNLLSEIRKNGYSRALIENGLPFTSEFIFHAGEGKADAMMDRFQLGYKFGKKFVQLSHRPDALVFYNDMLAIGFMQAAAEQGMKTPDDVAVVGYDDTPVAQYTAVPLTTIHQPADKIGYSAVETIEKRIGKNDVANRTIFKPSLVVRESSGANKKVATAPLSQVK